MLDFDKFIEETAYHIIGHGDITTKPGYEDYGRRLIMKYPCLSFPGHKQEWVCSCNTTTFCVVFLLTFSTMVKQVATVPVLQVLQGFFVISCKETQHLNQWPWVTLKVDIAVWNLCSTHYPDYTMRINYTVRLDMNWKAPVAEVSNWRPAGRIRPVTHSNPDRNCPPENVVHRPVFWCHFISIVTLITQ